MKEINQLIHSTSSIDVLKSILKNGLYTSYAKEEFCGENILIPMISFSNILYRDIGGQEVVNYGSYGIVIERDLALNKYGFNPVMYVSSDSEIAQSVKENFYDSMLPQTLELVKQFYVNTKNCCGKFLDNITINPLSDEVKSLINTIDENTPTDLIEAYKTVFEKVFINSRNQMLIIKPYKVQDKNNKEWIAYNEREWRKSFFELNFIKELTPKGEKNPEYEEWTSKDKPHYKDDKYTLKIPLSELQNIIVKDDKEIEEIENFLSNELGFQVENGVVSTLENLKTTEL